MYTRDEMNEIAKYKHGKTLLNKFESNGDKNLGLALEHYIAFRKSASKIRVLDKESVHKLVDITNIYRNSVIGIFEDRENSGQENLRSTILEEFMDHLFQDIVKDKIPSDTLSFFSGTANNSYVGLCFTPKSFSEIFSDPNPYIHTKDQDFVLGCLTNISVSSKGNDKNVKKFTDIVVPIIAAECKTYIERNMLDSCAGTARRLKAAMPYCMYLVVSEYLKMETAQPELTDIDEVFILCKATNGERLSFSKAGKPPHPIDKDVVYSLFEMVEKHISRIWWSPKDALERGIIIGRP